MELTKELLSALIPLVLVNYSLAAYCIYDMVKRGKPKLMPKAAWIPVVLIVQIFGSVAYLMIGRGDDSAEG